MQPKASSTSRTASARRPACARSACPSAAWMKRPRRPSLHRIGTHVQSSATPSAHFFKPRTTELRRGQTPYGRLKRRRLMRDANEHTITDAVLDKFADTPDPRLKTLVQALVRHLHGFVREVEPT